MVSESLISVPASLTFPLSVRPTTTDAISTTRSQVMDYDVLGSPSI
jgi:hypothetical protein